MDRIMVKGGSITAHVVLGLNYLNQKRNFAYDGRQWYYQPTKRSVFQPASAPDVPLPVVRLMAEKTGRSVEDLRLHPEQTPTG